MIMDASYVSYLQWLSRNILYSLYTEANETPLQECLLKLSMHHYLKTLACVDNPAHHALHEFDWTTTYLYAFPAE